MTKRWFKREHYDEIKDKLASTDWKPMTNMNVDEATTYLNDQIITIMDTICPITTKTLGNKPVNKWTTPGIRISLKRGTQLYKQSKKSAEKKIEYKAYKKVLESVIRKAKNMYYNDTLTAAGSDSRKLWGVINEVIDRKQTKHKIPHSFKLNDTTVDTCLLYTSPSPRDS